MADGWMPGVDHIPTLAFTKGGMQARGVQSHVMQGYQSTMIRWANERPVAATRKSAHFTINRAGRIAQHVSIKDQAWTAGHVERPVAGVLRPGENPNAHFIQIEHEGFSVPPGYGYDYVYGPGHPWPPALVEASIRVHKWVFGQLGIAATYANVITHSMTDSVNRANDPGQLWLSVVRPQIVEALRAAPAKSPLPVRKEDAVLFYLEAYGYDQPGMDIEALEMEGGKRAYKVTFE